MSLWAKELTTKTLYILQPIVTDRPTTEARFVSVSISIWDKANMTTKEYVNVLMKRDPNKKTARML